MKVIIAGSRTIYSPTVVEDAVKASGFNVTEVVHGGAHGVDALAFVWGWGRHIPVKCFPAEWEAFGKAAGPIRNRKMAEYGEALIAIWDGLSNGTASMIREAEAKGLKIYIHKVTRHDQINPTIPTFS